jgi:hypothetical protein
MLTELKSNIATVNNLMINLCDEGIIPEKTQKLFIEMQIDSHVSVVSMYYQYMGTTKKIYITTEKLIKNKKDITIKEIT